MAEEEKDDWLDDLDDDDDDNAGEVDQSDIDSLLSSGDDSGGGEDAELDQSDIDSLLSSGDDDDAELDQSDIDSLLSDTEEPETEAYELEPDQGEIDELFSEVESGELAGEDPFQAEEIDFKDAIDDDSGDDAAFDESAFDADEFGLDDDIPDIPLDDSDDTTIFDTDDELPEEPTQLVDPMPADQPQAAGSKLPQIAIPAILFNRKVQGGIGAILILLIVVGVYLFKGEEEVAHQPVQQDIVQPAAPPKAPEAAPQTTQVAKQAPNTAPMVNDTIVKIKQGANELAISLWARDSENDRLDYEILSLPEHGRLSGKAPDLIYLPNKNFPGEDTFVFRVNDGQDFSDPGTVRIMAPEPVFATKMAPQMPVQVKQPVVTAVPAKPKTIRSKQLIIAAPNKSFSLSSTENVLIDWEELWVASNYLPYTSDVKVEILAKNLHGKLKKVNNSLFDYYPDKYYGGQEYITYRFKLAKLKSKVKKLKFNIKMGNPAPEIKLEKLATNYDPGETVMIDASGSRDEHRENLKFSWEQISGVPVQLEFLNEEESQVAFVVPSTFNTVADPGPILRLTAVDKTGKKDVQQIKVATRSRRQNAVWRGLVSGGIAEEPLCPYGNCPGGLLPWPYSE